MLRLVWSTEQIYNGNGGAGSPTNSLMLLQKDEVVYGIQLADNFWFRSRTPTQDDYDPQSHYVPVTYVEVIPFPPAPEGGGRSVAASTQDKRRLLPPPPSKVRACVRACDRACACVCGCFGCLCVRSCVRARPSHASNPLTPSLTVTH